jgi:putative toxin-antitoxin system antitoxin component (TIGR02293 family)
VIWRGRGFTAEDAEDAEKDKRIYRGVANLPFGRYNLPVGTKAFMVKFASKNIKADGTPIEVVRLLRSGLPFEAIEQLQEMLDQSLDRVTQLSRISERTLARRKKEGRFNQDESERIHRLMTVIRRAVALFEGDVEATRRWLNTPRAVFDGKSALEFAETDVGAREVEDTIGRMEHGVIA